MHRAIAERAGLVRTEHHEERDFLLQLYEASAYLACGGFSPLACAEDHALVAALVADGYRVGRPRDLTVVTSARRASRVVGGFGDHLGGLSGRDRSRFAAGANREVPDPG